MRSGISIPALHRAWRNRDRPADRDGYDLSEGMVYTGWAAAERRSGRRYLPLEHQTRTAKRGLWRGRFTAE